MTTGVLFVSPHVENADRLSQILGSLPVNLEHVADLAHARYRLEAQPYPVILTDVALPDGAWVDVLNLANEIQPPPHVIVTDRFADARLWVDAMSRGVFDLLAQPFYPSEVQRILSNAFSLRACGFAG
jgi:DNA-binding NtrC family response regulator